MNLKKLKQIKKNQLLIILLCGVLLMIIAVPVKEKETGEKMLEAYGKEKEGELSENTKYAQYLEIQLKSILAQMEGVGEVDCMITLSQSAEQIVEKDLEISDDVVTETDSQGGTRTTNQSSRSEVTIYNEDENGIPYVSKEISPKVEGVLVVAEGGNNAVAVKNIAEAIQALFGIESHKIRVVKKGGE